MKLGQSNYLMRQLLWPSFMKMGWKMWIFYSWPIFGSVQFFLAISQSWIFWSFKLFCYFGFYGLLGYSLWLNFYNFKLFQSFSWSFWVTRKLLHDHGSSKLEASRAKKAVDTYDVSSNPKVGTLYYENFVCYKK